MTKPRIIWRPKDGFYLTVPMSLGPGAINCVHGFPVLLPRNDGSTVLADGPWPTIRKCWERARRYPQIALPERRSQ